MHLCEAYAKSAGALLYVTVHSPPHNVASANLFPIDCREIFSESIDTIFAPKKRFVKKPFDIAPISRFIEIRGRIPNFQRKNRDISTTTSKLKNLFGSFVDQIVSYLVICF